ncbi:MAG TPA: hypothetical protein VHV08_16395 [Pirellulales bacterium]|jgi:hypothetical protein|nr:hypothetical protein [Pirellulales bacterium]
MSRRVWFQGIVLSTVPALLLCGPASAQESAEQPTVRVARLVRELGSREFDRRQAADEQLGKLGHQSRAHLEAALQDDDVEVRLRAKQLLDKLKLDDLWSSAVVSYPSQGQSASQVLLALAAQSGNHAHIGDPYGRFAEHTLDVNYSQMSYWEAVDDICSRSGNRIRPHYDMHTPGIVVSAGIPPKYPRAYSGPVRAQITNARRVFIEEVNYEEHKAELTHSFQVSLQFTWEDRFGIVGYSNQPELVEAITDNKLSVAAAQPSGGTWSATTRGLRQVTASIKLNPVSVTARSFDVFKIRWGLIAVGEEAVLEIANLEPDQLHAQDDLSVRLESFEKQPPCKYIVSLVVARDLATREPSEAVFQEYETELVDSESRPLRLQNQTHAIVDRGVQMKLTFVSDSPVCEPKSLRLHYPRLRAHRDLELVFRNVPLPVGKPE